VRKPDLILTEAEFDLMFRQGGRRVAPGIWIDRDNAVHFSVPELMAMVDLDDTPENRAAVAESVRRSLVAAGFDEPIFVDKPR
jgi:hypothetical protein